MKKIRNHAFGAIVTATTLAAVVLTGCGNPEDECEGQTEASSMSLVTGLDGKVGGGSGGRGGGSRGGSSSKGSGSKSGGKVDTHKGGKQKPGAGSGSSGSSGGSVGGSGKSKFDDDDCED